MLSFLLFQKFADEILSSKQEVVEKYLQAKPKRRPRLYQNIHRAAHEDVRSEKVDMAGFTKVLDQKLEAMEKDKQK